MKTTNTTIVQANQSKEELIKALANKNLNGANPPTVCLACSSF